MKQVFWGILLAFLVIVHTAGCGSGGNTVEFPENPDPMPSQPPVAAGRAAPAAQPQPQPVEQE